MLTILALGAILVPAGVRAVPGYAGATEILKQEWKKRYPAEPKSIRSNPEGLGIYSSRGAYYYHFRVAVPRLVRAKDNTLKEEGMRDIEVWMRYRPSENSYDLAFVRRDLLPPGGVWIKR